jgi:hypothetical protein
VRSSASPSCGWSWCSSAARGSPTAAATAARCSCCSSSPSASRCSSPPGTALGTGIALGFGGPKRLGITLLAAATIAASDISTGEDVALASTYVLIATALVWVPVLLYVIFGRSATDWIERAQRVIAEHRSSVLFYPSLVVGLVLIGNALAEFATRG